jgi:hypothetical protein
MAGRAKSKFWSMHGTHRPTGVRFESGFEKQFIDQCYMQGIKVARCTVVVPYVDSEGKVRSYEPDFVWTDFDYVIEIKGAWALRTNHAWVREKFLAAQKHFHGRYTLFTERELRRGYVADLHRRLVHGD